MQVYKKYNISKFYFFPTSLNYFHFKVYLYEDISLILFTEFHYLSQAVITYTTILSLSVFKYN